MSVLRRVRCEWFVAVAVVAGLSCGGDDGGGTSNDTELSGVVWYSGPVSGASVTAWQIVDGARTGEIGTTTTEVDGTYHLDVGFSYGTIELEARGGSFTEATGGAVTLDGQAVLRGVELDVEAAEKRGDCEITPWSHLAVTLGEARLDRGDREDSYDAAMARAVELMGGHLGFDPVRSPIASLDDAASSPTEPVRYALSLAGLAEVATQVAADAGLTVQDVNSSDVVVVLANDIGSSEALFDGNNDILTLGPACGLPPGCDERGDGCRATCAIYWNTLRSRLALAISGFLGNEEDNHTGLAREDVQSWLDDLTNSAPVDGSGQPELFGGPTEPFDAGGPMITWNSPTSGATLAGTVAVEVTAADPTGVASLTVAIVGTSPAPVVDTDAIAEHFAGNLATVGMAEGDLVLRATAVDEEGNESTSDLPLSINNVDGGTISGVVVKGRVDGATVQVFEYADGAKGALLGEGTTVANGTFTNITLADGYAGPLLIEAGGGGTYIEEAAPNGSNAVTLDLADKLRSVVIDYADGNAVANAVVTPLTSFAVTYLEWLRLTDQNGVLADQWLEAHSTMESHFGVPNILQVTPLAPVELQSATLTAAAKYGLVTIGLSQTAYQASTAGGGDGGAFGTTMNSIRVWHVLDQDLADGCWDGRQGTTPLFWGGTQAVTAQATRMDLDVAIVAYLDDDARNVTAFTGAPDILSLLDTIAEGGPATGAGSCGSGGLFPDEGGHFDQDPPVVTFGGATPLNGAYVRGGINVAASAVDPNGIDIKPSTTFSDPDEIENVDNDGDLTDADAAAPISTLAHSDGSLTVTALSTDDSGNTGSASRTYTVDNTAPVITVSGVTNGAVYNDSRSITFGQNDTNPGTTTATLDGSPYISGALVSAEASHTLVVNATDLAGNPASTVTITFAIDRTAPAITITGVADGTYYNANRTIVYTSNDPHLASITATLNGSPFTSGTATAAVTNDELTYALHVVATDDAGWQTTRDLTFYVDRKAPVISVTGLTSGTIYQDSRTANFSQTDGFPGTTTAMLNGLAYTSGTLITLEADHTLVVNATDLAGNAATQVTVTFGIDRTAPVINVTGVADGAYYNVNKTITYSQTDAHPVSITATLNSQAFSSGSATSAAANTEVTYSLHVVATDAAGWQTIRDVTFRVDRKAPVITVNGVTNGAVYSDSQSATFFQTDGNPGTTTATLDGLGYSSGTLITLEADHTLVVNATDLAGNQAVPLSVSFAIDRTAPTISVAGITDGAFYNVNKTITYSQVDPHPGTTTATLNASAFSSGGATSVNANQEVDFTLHVVATDQAGWTTTRDVVFNIDRILPTISLATGPSVVLDGITGYYWVPDRGPILGGSSSDAHLASVELFAAGSWRAATFGSGSWNIDLPSNTLLLAPSTNPIQVRATDLGGNITYVIPDPTIMVDAGAPQIDVLTSQMRQENGDGVSWSATEAPQHTHSGTQIDLSGAQTCDTSTTGPQVYKYTYLLDASLPAGVSENASNPIRFRFQPSDPNGAGIESTTAEYQVRKQSDAWPSGWSSAGTPDGSGTYTVNLYRAAFLKLATDEAVFEIRFRANDLFGNPAPVQTRCWGHHPLTPALHVYSGAAADPTIDATDAVLKPLKGMTLGTDAIAGNNPDDDDSDLAAIVNNDGTYVGAAIMKVKIANGTDESAYLTFSTAASNPLPTYERDWVISNAESAEASDNTSCGCTSSGANCNPTAMPASTPRDGVVTAITSSTRLNLKVRVVDSAGNDATFSGGRYQLLPRTNSATPRIYTAIIVTTGLPDLQFPTSPAPTTPPPYNSKTLQLVGPDRQITGTLAGTFTRCLAFNDVTDTDVCPGVGNKLRLCTQRGTYQTYTAMTKAALAFNSAQNPLKLMMSAAPTASLPLVNWPERSLQNFSWSTNESGLPTCDPYVANCPPAP